MHGYENGAVASPATGDIDEVILSGLIRQDPVQDLLLGERRALVDIAVAARRGIRFQMTILSRDAFTAR
jgi:hypothetical protein